MGLQVATYVRQRLYGSMTDAELVRRTLSGDTHCYDVLVQRYQRQVYSLLFRLLGNATDAEDLLQETFIKAYRALHSFRQDASFLTWLYKIAANLSIDLMRMRRSRATASLDEEADFGREPPATDRRSDPEETAMREAVAESVHEAIMELPERYRRAVLLRHVADMSIEEIAEALCLPTGTVKTHLFRARAILRERLRPALGMDEHGSE